jgi:hypothetical protein
MATVRQNEVEKEDVSLAEAMSEYVNNYKRITTPSGLSNSSITTEKSTKKIQNLKSEGCVFEDDPGATDRMNQCQQSQRKRSPIRKQSPKGQRIQKTGDLVSPPSTKTKPLFAVTPSELKTELKSSGLASPATTTVGTLPLGAKENALPKATGTYTEDLMSTTPPPRDLPREKNSNSRYGKSLGATGKSESNVSPNTTAYTSPKTKQAALKSPGVSPPGDRNAIEPRSPSAHLVAEEYCIPEGAEGAVGSSEYSGTSRMLSDLDAGNLSMDRVSNGSSRMSSQATQGEEGNSDINGASTRERRTSRERSNSLIQRLKSYVRFGSNKE